MALETVEIHATYRKADDATPLSGQIEFELTAPLQDAAGNVIYEPVTVFGYLDGDGIMRASEDGVELLQLVATDAAGVEPINARYRVTHRLYDPATGAKYRRPPYLIEVLKDPPGGFTDLADIAPAVPVDPTVTYVTWAEFLTHVEGTAAENVHPGYLTDFDDVPNPWLGIQNWAGATRWGAGPFFSPEFFIDANGGDHYLGWQALKDAVNAAGGGTIVCMPDAHYFIDEHRITGGPNVNDIDIIEFVGCNALVFFWNGATFEVRGDFHRYAQSEEGGVSATTSYEEAVHLHFTDCTNVAHFDIGGLDGNVDQMTRTAGVNEAAVYGLGFAGCERVLVDGFDIHHWQTDGFRFSASNTSVPRRACKQVVLRNGKSRNNARQACSPIQVRELFVENCDLIDTGLTDGAYTPHLPQAGMDIEPTLHADTGDVDVETGLIRVTNSRIEGNLGGTILLAQPKVDRVKVDNTKLAHASDADGGGDQALIFACKGGVIEDCDIDTADGQANFTWAGGNPSYRVAMIRGSLSGGGATGTGKGAIVDDNVTTALFDGVKFICTAAVPLAGGGRFPWFTGQKVSVQRCDFFWPAAYFGGAAGASWIAGFLKNGLNVDNTFDTDFAPVGGQYFYVDTTGSGGGVTICRNDRYKNDAAKPIRPYLNSAVDPALPFSRGPVSVGESAIWRALSNQMNRVVFDDHAPAGAAPNGGAWAKGDRVFNSNPAEAGAAGSKYVITGWICTVAGSPGTWLQMRCLTGN